MIKYNQFFFEQMSIIFEQIVHVCKHIVDYLTFYILRINKKVLYLQHKSRITPIYK